MIEPNYDYTIEAQKSETRIGSTFEDQLNDAMLLSKVVQDLMALLPSQTQ